MPTMDEIRSCNDGVMEAMRRYPGRILGYCFVVPGFWEAMDEIDRCLDAGMIGINQGCGGAQGTPWVGARQSGYGFHSGLEGHRQFTQVRVVSHPCT